MTMKAMSRSAALAVLVSGLVVAADVSNPTPVSTNKDDAPPRVKSGKVFESTDSDFPPAIGPAQAKVLVLVFSDFQCPVCKRSADATDQIAEEFPGDVRVEFWQHPLTSHANAENAAVAALAAQRQGRFWDYHDEVFRNQTSIDQDSLARYAVTLGMDGERFKRDVADPALRERARREAATAEALGAKSTPAFMINGKLKVGWGSWYAFRGEVEREVGEAKKLVEQGTPVERVAALRAQAQLTDPESFRVYKEQVLRDIPEAGVKTKKRKK